MPRLHPAHQKHCPQDPSPLGRYEYTAADIEEHTAPAVPAGTRRAERCASHRDGAISRASRSSSASSSPSSSYRSPSRPRRRRRSAEQDGDGEFEESRRKRRRLVTIPEDGDGREVSLTIEYARPSASPAHESSHEELSTPSSSDQDAGWSFRALEYGQTSEDTLQERSDSGLSGSGDAGRASDGTAGSVSNDSHADPINLVPSSNPDSTGPASEDFDDATSYRMSLNLDTTFTMSAPSPEHGRDSIPSSQPDQDNRQTDSNLQQEPSEAQHSTDLPDPADISPPDSPEEVPARAPPSDEGLGRLGPAPRRGCVST